MISVTGQAQVQAVLSALIKVAPQALAGAVANATQQLQRGVQSRTHVLTGTLKSAQSMEVKGLLGNVFIAQKQSPLGGLTTTYGPVEEGRGGDHAAYQETFSQDAATVGQQALDDIIKALP